jgi:phage shock protein A
MSGMNDKSAFESFDRMAEKIEAIERKALAAAELQAEFQSDDLMAQFKKLEYRGTADQQLLELKTKMGLVAGGKQTKALGAGGQVEPQDAQLLENPDKP